MSKQFIIPGDSFEPFTRESIEQSIPKRLEYIATKFSDKTAISTCDGQYSYKQLTTTANRIAHTILKMGYESGTPMAVLLEQGPPQIIASMGILKAGMFYVPLDPLNPESRNRHMLEDSGAIIVVTDAANIETARGIADLGQVILNVDQISTDCPNTGPNVKIDPSALAYVLYTSGSTGKPKGIMHSHRNILHNVMRHSNAFCLTSHDRQTLVYTSSVYGGQRDMYNALLNGASLHVYVVKKEGIAGLADWIVSHGITIYCSVATIFRQFTSILTGAENFETVRLIKLGGEASYKRDVDAYKKYFSPECVMHCGLSATETGLARNFFIDKSTVVEKAVVPLGYPQADLDVVLLDDAGKPLREDGTGEISVSSKYISMGYCNNPELTNQVFLTDPDDPDVRIYKTGDMGEIHPGGLLEHRGRKDSQIKIRGNRIEVAEIDMVLVQQNNIKETAIIGRKDHQGIDKLVAYIVTKDGTESDVKELRKAVSARLPEYMVPSYFVWLPELPLLPNGKIDRKLLPEPDSRQALSSVSFIGPDSLIEKKLVEIWAGILNIPRIGVNNNFFELGGDSLSAVMMLAAIEKQLGTGLPTTVLAEEPTIEKLASALEGKVSCMEWSVIVPIKKSGSNPPLFCVHGVFGSTFFSRILAYFLDEQQPLYSLQSQRLDGKYFNYKDVQQVAALYLEQIRQVQPEGPYHVSGYSFGGLVALEIAQQLKKQRQSVGMLIIFDSSAPTIGTSRKNGLLHTIVGMPSEILDYSAKSLTLQRKLGVRTSFGVLLNKLKSASKYAKYLLIHAYLKIGFTLPVMMRDEYLAWNHYRIGSNYYTTPFDHDIVLFFTQKKKNRIVPGWHKATTQNLISFGVSGEHQTLFNEPHINVLAEHLNQYIKEFNAGI